MLCATIQVPEQRQPCASPLINGLPSDLVQSPTKVCLARQPERDDLGLEEVFLDSPRKKTRCRDEACQQYQCHCFRLAGLETSLAKLDPPLSPAKQTDKRTSTKKRVRFARDSNKRLLRHYQTSPFPYPDTPKEASKVWCQPQEFLLFKHEAKRDCRKVGDGMKRHFRAMNEACRTKEGLSSIRTADSAALAAVDYRGLEHILFRSLHNRKILIHSVVQRQDELKNCSIKERITELSNLSCLLSQQA